jgi:hypothetical protein
MRHVFLSLLFGIVSLQIAPAQQAQGLLKLAHVWPANQQDRYWDCVLVDSDGSYALTRSVFDLHHGVVSERTYTGRLEEREIDDLNLILANPDLISLGNTPKNALIEGRNMFQLEFLKVAIPRSSGMQLLVFDTGVSKPPLPSLNRTPAIKPLYKWYWALAKNRGTPIPNMKADCTGKWEGE